MSTIVIRPLEPHHVNYGLLECLAALSPVELNRVDALSIQWLRERAGITTLGAFDGNRVVGTASFWVEQKLTRGGIRVAHINDVAVHPEHQGKGIGKLLLGKVKEASLLLGCSRVELDCDDKLVPYYKSLGFTPLCNHMRLELHEHSAGD